MAKKFNSLIKQTEKSYKFQKEPNCEQGKPYVVI